jgi:pimeloyl-ACP methyl ester carboxylesterase
MPATSTLLTLRARLIAAALLLVVALPYFLFTRETRTLNASAREEAGPYRKFVRLSDGVVSYEIGGPANGERVILVSGLATPLFIWDATFRDLTRAGFHVLRYELYGRGYSDRPRAVYGPELYLRQLHELRGASGFAGPAHIVGLSMGGVITTLYAARHPESVRNIALISPAGYPVPIPARARAAETPLLGDWLIGALGDPLLLGGLGANTADQQRYPEYRRNFEPQMQFRGFKAALLSSLRNMPLGEIKGAYSQVYTRERPLLLLWGDLDRVIPVEVGRRMADENSAVRLIEIHGAGHISHWERPDLVSPLLIQHLRAP